jgi:hypothetical protein
LASILRSGSLPDINAACDQNPVVYWWPIGSARLALTWTISVISDREHRPRE